MRFRNLQGFQFIFAKSESLMSFKHYLQKRQPLEWIFSIKLKVRYLNQFVRTNYRSKLSANKDSQQGAHFSGAPRVMLFSAWTWKSKNGLFVSTSSWMCSKEHWYFASLSSTAFNVSKLPIRSFATFLTSAILDRSSSRTDEHASPNLWRIFYYFRYRYANLHAHLCTACGSNIVTSWSNLQRTIFHSFAAKWSIKESNR